MPALSEQVALRIALAARALPEVEVKDLLPALLTLVGEPMSEAKLSKLRLGRLKQVDLLSEIEDVYLKQSLAFLKGQNIQTEPVPLPEPQAYIDGEIADSIRVACASNTGDKIDGHFGSCQRFLIYQLSPTELRLIDIRSPAKVAEDEDKNAYRAKLVNDCQVLYTVSIGGPAAAKVVRAGLHPIKIPNGGEAPEVLAKLQHTLADAPPPWLAKVMGVEVEERVRFREEDDDDRATAY